MPLVTSGVEYGNLRELATKRMQDLNLPCRDVRAREVGIQEIHNKVTPETVELIRRDYYANGGWETFIFPQRKVLLLFEVNTQTGQLLLRYSVLGNIRVSKRYYMYSRYF